MRVINGSATITYKNRQLFDDEDVASWDSKSVDERINELCEGILYDCEEDIGMLKHDYKKDLLNSFIFIDEQGRTASIKELSEMTGSELVLRGFLQPEED